MPICQAISADCFNPYQHLSLHQEQLSKSPVVTKLVAPILHKRKIVITFAPQRSPDGGIGRRAGLKHQWSNPSRFDPGSGYAKKGAEQSASFFMLFCHTTRTKTD